MKSYQKPSMMPPTTGMSAASLESPARSLLGRYSTEAQASSLAIHVTLNQSDSDSPPSPFFYCIQATTSVIRDHVPALTPSLAVDVRVRALNWIDPSLDPSIHPSIDQSINQFIHPSIHPSTHPSLPPSLPPSLHQSINQSINPSRCAFSIAQAP